MSPALRQRATVLALALLFAACATEPGVPEPIDASGELVEASFVGDGFVYVDGERLPLDAWLLRMRQRLRTMDAAAREKFGVQLRMRQGINERAAQKRADAELNRTLEQLEIMGVGYVRFP